MPELENLEQTFRELGGHAAPPAPRLSVYEINDCEWVVAHSAEEALRCFMETTGCTREESLVDDREAPIEVTEQQLDALTVWDEDTDTTATFRVRLAQIREKGEHVPAIFASTEF